MERERVWDVVVREANTDYLARGSRLPTPSTAVERKAFSIGPGGKGATQAVAAARLGIHVTLLGQLTREGALAAKGAAGDAFAAAPAVALAEACSRERSARIRRRRAYEGVD